MRDSINVFVSMLGVVWVFIAAFESIRGKRDMERNALLWVIACLLLLKV